MGCGHCRAIEAFPICCAMAAKAITTTIDARHFGMRNVGNSSCYYRSVDQSQGDIARDKIGFHFILLW
jgi:hypothetical protein